VYFKATWSSLIRIMFKMQIVINAVFGYYFCSKHYIWDEVNYMQIVSWYLWANTIQQLKSLKCYYNMLCRTGKQITANVIKPYTFNHENCNVSSYGCYYFVQHIHPLRHKIKVCDVTCKTINCVEVCSKGLFPARSQT